VNSLHIFFGKRLKKLREERQLNQEDIAKITGGERSTIAKWETASSIPNAKTLDLLASYFNVSVDYLLGRTDARNERRKLPSRRKSWEFKDDDETLTRRMIGPELAYSTGLAAIAKAAGLEFDTEVLGTENATPPSDVTTILGLAPGEQALKRTQIQNLDGTPSRVVTSWMPIDLFADIVDRRSKPLFEMLEETKGIYAVRVEERVRASSMTAELANLLKTDPGACTLEMQRVVYADIGRVIEVWFNAAAGRLWELAYKYTAGRGISAPDWSWIRYTPV
jgi:transcriptional regulator with XRE-family HTH domain